MNERFFFCVAAFLQPSQTSVGYECMLGWRSRVNEKKTAKKRININDLFIGHPWKRCIVINKTRICKKPIQFQFEHKPWMRTDVLCCALRFGNLSACGRSNPCSSSWPNTPILSLNVSRHLVLSRCGTAKNRKRMRREWDGGASEIFENSPYRHHRNSVDLNSFSTFVSMLLDRISGHPSTFIVSSAHCERSPAYMANGYARLSANDYVQPWQAASGYYITVWQNNRRCTAMMLFIQTKTKITSNSPQIRETPK